MEKLLISVIVPVYNKEKYIANAIESVLRQPFKNIEIILINDGATDGSSIICKKYANEYENIKYIEQTNKGASCARNLGMAHAKGKYIMFLDADDQWVPNVFDRYMEQILQTDVDIVMCSSYLSNIDRNRFAIDLQVRDLVVNGHQIFPMAGTFASCIYKHQMLKDNEIYFDEGIRISEDQLFKVKAFYAADQIRMVSRFLDIYNKTLGSIMHSCTIDQFDRVLVWQQSRDWFIKHGRKEHIQQLMHYVDTKISARMPLYAKLFVQMGHKKEEMIEELKRVNGYEMLLSVSSQQVMPYQVKELSMFQTDMDAFVKNARLEGLKLKVGRTILNINFIRRFRDKKKYPIESI